jgi:hypothetical protein
MIARLADLPENLVIRWKMFLDEARQDIASSELG